MELRKKMQSEKNMKDVLQIFIGVPALALSLYAYSYAEPHSSVLSVIKIIGLAPVACVAVRGI